MAGEEADKIVKKSVLEWLECPEIKVMPVT
jgi:hypothetical protein